MLVINNNVTTLQEAMNQRWFQTLHEFTNVLQLTYRKGGGGGGDMDIPYKIIECT
jgi:hypothetical protein